MPRSYYVPSAYSWTEKDNNMNYDEAIARIEAIVKELEQSEALSMDVYKAKAKEAKNLLDFCENQLAVIQDNLTQA